MRCMQMCDFVATGPPWNGMSTGGACSCIEDAFDETINWLSNEQRQQMARRRVAVKRLVRTVMRQVAKELRA